MIQTIQFCLTGICLFIYVPILVNAIRHIQHGSIELQGRSLFRATPRRYTGAAVWAYAGGQALSAIILIVGGLSAIQRDNLLFLLFSIIVSWLVGLAGLQLADRIGYEEIQDPHTEAMNNIWKLFSSVTRTSINKNDLNLDSEDTDKHQPIIITFGNQPPSTSSEEDNQPDTSTNDERGSPSQTDDHESS